MKATILIIVYKDVELALRCRDRVIETTSPWRQDIIVHNNTEMNENIHVLWNRFLGQCENEFFCVLNPDTRPEPLWLHRMVDLLHAQPSVAAVGPSTNRCYNEQANRHPQVVSKSRGSWVPGVLIPGFCAVYRTDVLKKLGGWRESFKFYGGDIDLAYRIRLAGQETAWCVPSFVWHEWGTAAKGDGDARYRELREIGNKELQESISGYGERPGVWVQAKGRVKWHPA